MGNKINIAKLLKDCPKGMELDCSMFDNVTFVRVDNSRKQFPIEIAVSGLHSKYLTKEGCFHDTTLLPEAKCVIFPKGKTTWEGFVPPCKFEVGDNIRMKSTSAIYVVTEIREDRYMLDDKDISLRFKTQDQWELVPNRFDINTLVPFESKVLVRDSQSTKWRPAIWGFYNEDNSNYPYEIIGGIYFSYCIPYEGNEHLRGTTDDCDDYYKTWE